MLRVMPRPFEQIRQRLGRCYTLCYIFSESTSMHTTTLRAAGGSVALTIPQALVRTLGLQIGDKVELDAQQGRLVIIPATRLKYSLEDLLAMQGNEPLMTDPGWDAMPAMGNEAPL